MFVTFYILDILYLRSREYINSRFIYFVVRNTRGNCDTDPFLGKVINT